MCVCFFFFNDTATPEIYTLTHSFPTRRSSDLLQGSVGDYSFFRIFGAVDTGVFTPWGTKAFFSASHAENDNVFNDHGKIDRSEEHTSELQSLMRISYAVFCLKKKKNTHK